MNEYDGDSIYETEDCPDCIYRKNGDECHWGVAWKKLVPREKGPMKCQKRGRRSPREKKPSRPTGVRVFEKEGEPDALRWQFFSEPE